MGVVQVGEQKAPLVQANFLAAIPLLKKLFVKQPPQTVKVPEPTPQPEWFNAGAAGMKFTLYDENNTPLYSETMAVGNISPTAWGRLVQKYDITQNGTIEVELFNYNTTPTYFDDWHIELTENSKPEIVQEVHYDPWGLVMEDESYFASVSPANGADLFNRKELQTYADLNLYDYHWRQYDPQLGRFHVIDPSADKYHAHSPYAYCFNNPVMLIDPDGREIVTAMLIGAFIGGTINLGVKLFQPGKIKNVGDAFAAFGIGAAAGVAGVLTGGAALSAATGLTFSATFTAAGVGAGGFLGGVASGAAGAAANGLVRGIGNMAYFGDAYSASDFLGEVALGGVFGGVTNGIFSAVKGNNFWNGVPRSSTGGIFSINDVKNAISEGWQRVPTPEGTKWARVNAEDLTFQSAGVNDEISILAGTKKNDVYVSGSFSITDWANYPTVGGVPIPQNAVFRLLEGAEYEAARNLANATNRGLHQQGLFKGLEIHEIHPVKFGGSPTDLANKIGLPRPTHTLYTTWWNRLQRHLKK